MNISYIEYIISPLKKSPTNINDKNKWTDQYSKTNK